VMARSPVLDKCPNGHDIYDVTIWCTECGEFTLFLRPIFREKRSRTLVQGILIVLSTVLSVGIFRFTHEVWPLYLYLMVGIVHLYAAIFTRGTALKSASWFLTGTAVVTAGLAIATNGFGRCGPHAAGRRVARHHRMHVPAGVQPRTAGDPDGQ
jgi:hypothetical protein